MKSLLSCYLLIALGVTNLLAQNGLKADYYDGTEFNRYVATNYVDKIDFYWNRTPPVKGINPNKCSVRYTGRLKSPKTGVFTFSARVDDGIRVWVDEKLIINNWRLNDVGYSNGSIEMKANQYYDLKIEYFNALLEAELRLLWQLPSDDKEKSWLESWWYGEEAEIISAQYFAPPLEQIAEVIPEPQPAPVITPKSKPTPKPQAKPKTKPKPKSKPSTTVQKPVLIPQEKKQLNLIEQYIPKSVAFERTQSDILPVSYPELDKLADFLVKHPTRKVRIEGHTDNTGDMEKNLKLSERRAYAVAAYLVTKGVNAKQLSAKGFGGTKPLKTSSDKKYHPENRRVEFVVE